MDLELRVVSCKLSISHASGDSMYQNVQVRTPCIKLSLLTAMLSTTSTP